MTDHISRREVLGLLAEICEACKQNVQYRRFNKLNRIITKIDQLEGDAGSTSTEDRRVGPAERRVDLEVTQLTKEDRMTIEEIARVAHEVNRAYCQAIGDNSQAAWADAPEWQRTSAVNGVKMHIADPSAGPEASHENWMREKVQSGWVYGGVKDAEAKTHPCIVPFGELPREQQAKDYIFRAVVHALS